MNQSNLFKISLLLETNMKVRLMYFVIRSAWLKDKLHKHKNFDDLQRHIIFETEKSSCLERTAVALLPSIPNLYVRHKIKLTSFGIHMKLRMVTLMLSAFES